MDNKNYINKIREALNGYEDSAAIVSWVESLVRDRDEMRNHLKTIQKKAQKYIETLIAEEDEEYSPEHIDRIDRALDFVRTIDPSFPCKCKGAGVWWESERGPSWDYDRILHVCEHAS